MTCPAAEGHRRELNFLCIWSGYLNQVPLSFQRMLESGAITTWTTKSVTENAHMNQTISDIRVGKPYDATVESQGSCSNCSTTTTRAFLDILHAAKPDQQLVFQLNEAPLVAAGYHVT
jgi:hypothetical protein